MPCDARRFLQQRLDMVTYQLERRGLHDDNVLAAMRQVPRHCFIPDQLQDMAYEDRPLPIGHGQTISQPYMVGLMSALALPDPEGTVLEVGTGSGYQAAVLSLLFKQVFTIELNQELARNAERVFLELGMQNIHARYGDGSCGWEEFAPYQAILVTAASPRPPQPLLDQLAEDGRLVIPVGSKPGQTLQTWTTRQGVFHCTYSIPVVFVPLRGKFGWSVDDWEWYDS